MRPLKHALAHQLLPFGWLDDLGKLNEQLLMDTVMMENGSACGPEHAAGVEYIPVRGPACSQAEYKVEFQLTQPAATTATHLSAHTHLPQQQAWEGSHPMVHNFLGKLQLASYEKVTNACCPPSSSEGPSQGSLALFVSKAWLTGLPWPNAARAVPGSTLQKLENEVAKAQLQATTMRSRSTTKVLAKQVLKCCMIS